jgi:fumarate hydratase, class II
VTDDRSDGDGSIVRWGAETELAIGNFRLSGSRIPPPVIEALALIKAEAARVNGAAGRLDGDLAEAIATAADEVAAGAYSDQFPVDVFQSGSGTSTNMNVNEVVAHRATELSGLKVHPNDHVNAAQSTNDTMPSAIRLALGIAFDRQLVPSLGVLRNALEDLAAEHHETVKLGRTHLVDAVPMTFGDEAGAWARMIGVGIERIESVWPRLRELPLGGTAVGTGLNAPPGFGSAIAARLAERTGLDWIEAVDHFEVQAAQDTLLETSAALRSLGVSMFKIAGDIRLLSSGPVGGPAELRLPSLQAGSSIMPGKTNPVVPEAIQQVAAQVVGNDATLVFASTLSTLQLNTALPLFARTLTSSTELLSNASLLFAEKCIAGLVVDGERMRRLAEQTSALVTALAPRIGYVAAAAIAKTMSDEHHSLPEALALHGLLDVGVDLDVVARGNR